MRRLTDRFAVSSSSTFQDDYMPPKPQWIPLSKRIIWLFKLNENILNCNIFVIGPFFLFLICYHANHRYLMSRDLGLVSLASGDYAKAYGELFLPLVAFPRRKLTSLSLWSIECYNILSRVSSLRLRHPLTKRLTRMHRTQIGVKRFIHTPKAQHYSKPVEPKTRRTRSCKRSLISCRGSLVNQFLSR